MWNVNTKVRQVVDSSVVWCGPRVGSALEAHITQIILKRVPVTSDFCFDAHWDVLGGEPGGGVVGLEWGGHDMHVSYFHVLFSTLLAKGVGKASKRRPGRHHMGPKCPPSAHGAKP